jgi:hypothetical protein
MLRSTMKTVSAPASRSFRGSLPHPTQPLCCFVFGVAAASRNTRFQGPATALPGPNFAPADGASFAWRLPSYLVSAGEQRRRHLEAEQLRGSSGCDQSQQGSPYSITSSARTINVIGTWSPIALAALRLMITSNFVGCSTGRLEGLAPRRILST